jgi:hypothetical protein
MNFLSHFYFDKNSADDYIVLGTVLPDLLKNAVKEGNLHPLKLEHIFQKDPLQKALLIGWERHLLVDKIFHSSGFFQHQTAVLKQLLLPLLTTSPVKPFFLAHIGLELILDHLLTVNELIDTNKFYGHLGRIDQTVLKAFLNKCEFAETGKFIKFLEEFISSRYLLSYSKIENITYALNRICMRLWERPFEDHELIQLTEQLRYFKNRIEDEYLTIFAEVEFNLNHKGG